MESSELITVKINAISSGKTHYHVTTKHNTSVAINKNLVFSVEKHNALLTIDVPRRTALRMGL